MGTHKGQTQRKHQSGVFWICLVVVCLAVIFLTIHWSHADVPPSMGGYRLFRVVGNSMEPTFSNGSLLVVKSVEVTAIQSDDIITYHCPRSTVGLTTHRVDRITVMDTGCVQFNTRGDGNDVLDPLPVQACDVVGKVIWIVSIPTRDNHSLPPFSLLAGMLTVTGFILTSWKYYHEEDGHLNRHLIH